MNYHGGPVKKFLFIIPVLFLGVGMVYAQDTDSPVMEMDNAVKGLARDIHKKLTEEKAQKIAVGPFTYGGTIVPLGSYWVNQLIEELANIPDRSYIILAGGSVDADRTISGEILRFSFSIRVYTRVIRSEDRAVEAAFHSEILRNDASDGMLFPDDSRSVARAPMDEWEPDSMDNPVPYEIGDSENYQDMEISRTIHDARDQDFFLLVPASDGLLVMETTGSDVDTYMEFYDADTREKLAEDDDGGYDLNARIRYNVQAGRRYIAKVRGYGRDDIGYYGFRAYMTIPVTLGPDEYEPDDDPASAKSIDIGVPQQHTFHNGDDVDWVKFEVNQRGLYTIHTKGVRSNRLDTYIELFDENLNAIDEDDDSGAYLDSCLSLTLDAGLYYLKVSCLDSEPDQPYTISIEGE